MNILFASDNPYLPQVIGGVEVNSHQLARELLARGHTISMLARLSYRDWLGARNAMETHLRGRRVVCDARFGYPVYRTRRPSSVVAELPRPDVVVLQNTVLPELAPAFLHLSIPTFGYLHGLGFENWPQEQFKSLPMAGYFAAGSFTAGRFHQWTGATPQVLPPIFRAETYATTTSRRTVTFVNPVSDKGLDLALEIAAGCPEIPFRFVKGWPLTPRAFLRLRRQLASLPNVTLHERVADMRVVYRDTKVLLMPSVVYETWPRVVTEAHFSGIPVLASDHGGLPETVGAGGILLGARDPAERWIAALRRLWTDAALYDDKSRAALDCARRPLLDVDRQVTKFVNTLSAALKAAGKGAVASEESANR